MSDLGGWVTGVSAAPVNVGAKHQRRPQIGGLTAGKANIQTLKNGHRVGWTGYSLPIVGYSVVDSIARYFVGRRS